MVDVSVIIPVYNVEKYLKQCLDSVVNQTLKNIEIICVDDGSTDSSPDILKSYAEKDSRIIVKTQNNSGQGKARNKGMEVVSGEYIMFVDADDYLCLDACEKLFETAKSEKADCVIFDYNLVRDGVVTPKNILKGFATSKKTLVSDCYSIVCNFGREAWYMMYNTEFLKKNEIKFGERKAFEDFLFRSKLIAANPSLYILKEYLYNYVDIPNSSSKIWSKYYNDIFVLFEEAADILYKSGLPERVVCSFVASNLRWLNGWCASFSDLYKSKADAEKSQLLKKLIKRYRNTCLYNVFATGMLSGREHRLNFCERIFSVKNSPDKRHKIINFLGLKVKIKRRRKKPEVRMIVPAAAVKAPAPVLQPYHVPFNPPKSTYKVLVCPTGFGHSGSGTLLDYFSEFDNSTCLGFYDPDYSGLVKKFDTSISEIDFIRCVGGVFDLEKYFGSAQYFHDNFAVKMFLHVVEYWYRKGIIYTDYFWEITREFVDKIVDLKIRARSGFEGMYYLNFSTTRKAYANLASPLVQGSPSAPYIYYLKDLSVEEYRAIAREYITKFLRSIESKDFLVCDQILTNSKPETEKKLQYFRDFRQICVYRDPRDVYVTGIARNEPWMPKNPADFVKWYYHRGTPAYVEAAPHPNRLLVRFEDFVLNYDEVSAVINDFTGIKEVNHIHRREYFNPEVSKQNVGLYRSYPKQDEISFIEKELRKYCYYK